MILDLPSASHQHAGRPNGLLGKLSPSSAQGREQDSHLAAAPSRIAREAKTQSDEAATEPPSLPEAHHFSHRQSLTGQERQMSRPGQARPAGPASLAYSDRQGAYAILMVSFFLCSLARMSAR